MTGPLFLAHLFGMACLVAAAGGIFGFLFYFGEPDCYAEAANISVAGFILGALLGVAIFCARVLQVAV